MSRDLRKTIEDHLYFEKDNIDINDFWVKKMKTNIRDNITTTNIREFWEKELNKNKNKVCNMAAAENIPLDIYILKQIKKIYDYNYIEREDDEDDEDDD